MAQSGIDPHYHDPFGVPDLEELEVKYLGGGDWQLPAGADIEALSSDDWLLTLADGTEYRLWSQEDEVGVGSEDLLDAVFSSISPEEMQGLPGEEIRAATTAVNEESGIRGRILSREEIGTAAADIYYLNRETKPFEEVGSWWQDENIKLIRKGGSTYALHGWTGRQYAECWKCGGDLATESEGSYTITPVYNQITDEETELVDYEIEENL
jgi:hypothetical protein